MGKRCLVYKSFCKVDTYIGSVSLLSYRSVTWQMDTRVSTFPFGLRLFSENGDNFVYRDPAILVLTTVSIGMQVSLGMTVPNKGEGEATTVFTSKVHVKLLAAGRRY